MASSTVQISYSRVEHLERGDIIRFMDGQDLPVYEPSFPAGWLVVERIEPHKSKTEHGIHDLIGVVVWDGVTHHKTIRRPWTTVELQVQSTFNPFNQDTNRKWELPPLKIGIKTEGR